MAVGQKPTIRLIAIFWIIAIVLGAFHAWAGRHVMDPDGISYLDIGDAYFRGDWNTAINAFWSPLYPWLLGLAMRILKPSPYWEFAVVHLVNFAAFLCALGCFHIFLLELIRYHRNQTVGASGDGRVTLPEWAWLALGYILFFWSSFSMIVRVTPDTCVAASVYLTASLLLRIRRGVASWLTFVLLGVVLGFGYLAKAIMFPMAFVFLGVSLFSVGSFRRALPRVLMALVIFLLVTGPFIVAISKAKGRLTFGESGRLNYAWHVNGITPHVHWQGENPGSGTPKHPTRKIFDAPAIYEFGSPIGGTYPPLYDPSYWYEGVRLHFDLKEQINVLVESARFYFNIFFRTQPSLVVGFLILCLMSRRGWLCVKDVVKHSSLLIPGIAALGIYSLVHVEQRYISPFVVLLWAGAFSGVSLPDSEESGRLLASVSMAMLLIMAMMIGPPNARVIYSVACDLMNWRVLPADLQWQVADGLSRMGIQPRDSVASIGNSDDAYWARLAKVRIVAEMPSKDADTFWAADDAVKSQVIQTFARAGAKVIVAEKAPSHISTIGWQQIGKTDHYVYFLSFDARVVD
jgi:hypothetical protein